MELTRVFFGDESCIVMNREAVDTTGAPPTC